MLEHAKYIHCIGIGGIGVSALAQLWRAQGKIVSGSDAEESEVTRALEKQGMRVEIHGRPPLNLPLAKGEKEGVDLVIYSDAIPEDHPERVAARTRDIPELSYAQALGEVSRAYRTIVVTGTHGKSTTTALLGLMLEAGGLDPLVIMGSKVREWGNSNVRLCTTPNPSSTRRGNEDNSSPARGEVRRGGSGRVGGWLVVEGDDYRDHFLELAPYAVVVTSIEWDHPDYFRDLTHTVESFRKLVEKVPEDGFVVVNEDDAGCRILLQYLGVGWGLVPHRGGAQGLALQCRGKIVTYTRQNEIFSKLTPQVPGEFNRYNATAAATAAMELGVPREVVERVAHDFRGIWRRFEVVGTLPPPLTPPLAGGEKSVSSPFEGEVRRGPITIVSDYAHHPTAIRATMKAAREAYPDRRLVLVYQPHQHSRTKHLFKDFVEALSDVADLVIVSEIYAVKGRMENRDVSSRDLVEAIKRLSDEAIESNNSITQSLNNSVFYGGDLEETKQVVLEHVWLGDVVIFMGAGDIDSLAREMTSTNSVSNSSPLG